jgi:hypothetical protein
MQDTKEDEQLEDVLTESMLLHEGFEVNSVNTSIEQGVIPRAVVENPSKSQDEKQYIMFDGEITVSDLEKSAESELPNDRPLNYSIENNLIESEHLYGSETDESVYVIDYDTYSAVKCDVGYLLRVQFENPVGEQWELVKFFENQDEAIEASVEVESATSNGGLRLVYQDGDYLLEKDGTLLETAKNSADYAFNKNRDVTGTLLVALIFSGIAEIFTQVPHIVVYFATGIVLPLILGTYDILYRYRDDNWSVYSRKYKDQESHTAQSFVSTKDAGIDPEHTVMVDVDMLDDKVRIESDKLDTHWNFDINDGVMEEDGVQFFEQLGFDVSDGDQIEMTAVRKELTGQDESAVLCEDSEWYLYPTKFND